MSLFSEYNHRQLLNALQEKLEYVKSFFEEIEKKKIIDYKSLPENDITLLLRYLKLKEVPYLTKRQLQEQSELVTNITHKFDYIFIFIKFILEQKQLDRHDEFKTTITTNLNDIEKKIAEQLESLADPYDDAIIKHYELAQKKSAEDQAKSAAASAAAKEVHDQYVREMFPRKRENSGGGRRIKKRSRRHKKKRGKKTRGKRTRKL